VLEDRQVLTVGMRKIFPDRLEVQVTERLPVARVRVALGEAPRDLLVARDGVVFAGTGFDPMMIRTLPWLDGIALAQDGAHFAPVPHMETVTRLLAEAQFSAPHLYHQWLSVSLARMELDREIEVTFKSGTKARFSAKGRFFVQLAHLDHIVGTYGRSSRARLHIDLTLGRDVPVTIEMASTDAPSATGSAGQASPLLSRSQSKTQREL
jgi:cell division protein FtsQ